MFSSPAKTFPLRSATAPVDERPAKRLCARPLNLAPLFIPVYVPPTPLVYEDNLNESAEVVLAVMMELGLDA
jgi:hypothetical protein